MKVIFAQFKQAVKQILRDDSKDLVSYEGRTLWKHDVTHLEVAKLPPIQIGGFWVNGIDGICIPEFENEDQEPKYEGMLDEVRIGFHTWLTRPEHLYSWVIFVNYTVFCLHRKVNPVRVIFDHIKSMG